MQRYLQENTGDEVVEGYAARVRDGHVLMTSVAVKPTTTRIFCWDGTTDPQNNASTSKDHKLLDHGSSEHKKTDSSKRKWNVTRPPMSTLSLQLNGGWNRICHGFPLKSTEERWAKA